MGVALLYVAVVGWLTWPLGAHLPSALSAAEDATRYDALYATWVLAWESHALATAPGRLPDANIYAPERHALFYGPTAFGALPFFAPVYLATGNPTLATNLMYLGAVALTATALHAVVVRWTGVPLAGLVAAWTLLTTRWMLWEFVATAPYAAVLFYFPLVILRAADPAPGRRAALALLALVTLQCLTDVTYVAPAVLLPLLGLAIVRLLRRPTRSAGRALLLVVVIAALVTLPVWAGHLAVARENPLLRSQTIWPRVQAPTVLPWGPIGRFAPMAVQPVVLVLIGLGALVRALWRKDAATPLPAWLHAAYWSAAGLALSLTPVVTWNGAVVHLPTWMLERWLPLSQYLRVPSRLGVAGLMGLALLAGLACAECANRLPGRGRGTAAAALVVLLLAASYAQFARGFSWPFVRPALWRTYPVQPAIGADDPLLVPLGASRGPVLELPLNAPQVKSGGRPGVPFRTTYKPYLHAAAMYRSIFHWRPLLNGYSSYYPASWRERMRSADALPSPAALAALRRETGIETIVVHTALCAPGVRERWLAATTGRDDLRLAARVGSDLVFAVQPAAGS